MPAGIQQKDRRAVKMQLSVRLQAARSAPVTAAVDGITLMLSNRVNDDNKLRFPQFVDQPIAKRQQSAPVAIAFKLKPHQPLPGQLPL
jgi:hypothetical protein